MNVLISRHGETEWNTEGRFQGHRDSPITKKGSIQNMRLIEVLKKYNPKLIFCSDLSRACVPAEIASENLKIEIIKSEIFRERFLGEAEGLNIKEIKSRWLSVYTGRLGAEINIENIPGSEKEIDFSKRVLRSIIFIKNEKSKRGVLPHENVFLLTHGIFISKAFELFQGKNFAKVEHSKIYKITID